MGICAICQAALDGSPGGCRYHEQLAGVPALLTAQVESEHQRLARVRHPHLVPVLGCGRAPDGALYVKSEPRDGEPLARRIERGLVPWAEAKRLIAQVGEALLEVHKAGLIHRDLAPENVVITPEGEARLFHVAVPRRASALGDPYTPPEQRDGRPLDRRANTFSLGVLLYHTATGSAPPPAGGGPMRPPSSCRPGLPGELDRLVAKSLEANPMARHPLLRGFLSELDALPVPSAGAPKPVSVAASGPVAPPLPSVAVPVGRPAGVRAPADRVESARAVRSMTVAGFAPLAKLGVALPGAEQPRSDEPGIDKDEIARLVNAMSRPTAPSPPAHALADPVAPAAPEPESELTADEVLQAKKRLIEQMVRQAKTSAAEKAAAPVPARGAAGTSRSRAGPKAARRARSVAGARRQPPAGRHGRAGGPARGAGDAGQGRHDGVGPCRASQRARSADRRPARLDLDGHAGRLAARRAAETRRRPAAHVAAPAPAPTAPRAPEAGWRQAVTKRMNKTAGDFRQGFAGLDRSALFPALSPPAGSGARLQPEEKRR